LLLADALHHANANPPEFRRAVLLAAIALETKVKVRLRDLAKPANLPLLDFILANPRDVSVSAAVLFDRVLQCAAGRSLRIENKALFKRLERLFEVRNKLAHRGIKPSDVEAKDGVFAAREVFAWLT
jgi:hypothetical protein